MLIIDTMIYERSLYSNGLRGVMQDPKGDKPRVAGSNLSFENILYSLTLPLTPDSPSGSGGGTLSSQKRQSSASPQPPPVVLPKCTLHNAGNVAFMCLFVMQKLLEPKGTVVPSTTSNTKKARTISTPSKFSGLLPVPAPGVGPIMSSVPISPGMMPMMNWTINGSASPNMHYTTAGFAAVATTPTPMATTIPMSASASMPSLPRSSLPYDLADEFGQMQLSRGRKGYSGAAQHQYLTAPGRSVDRRSKSPAGILSAKINE